MFMLLDRAEVITCYSTHSLLIASMVVNYNYRPVIIAMLNDHVTYTLIFNLRSSQRYKAMFTCTAGHE
jgi:hypothetical protein